MGAQLSLQPQAEEIATLEVIRPPIKSFFEKITEEQWLLLKTGVLDGGTEKLLAEFLLELIAGLSDALLAEHINLNVVISEELVVSTVVLPLTRSLAEFLVFEDKVKCNSIDLLSDLIVQEVTEIADSVLGIVTDAAEAAYVTAPCRLSAMISHASNILHTLECKVFVFKTPAQRLQAKKIHAAEPQDSGELSAVRYVREEVKNITMPLLKDLPDFEYELFQSSASLEVDNAAAKIYNFMEKNISRLDNPKIMLKVSLELRSKIENILAKQLIKASICHIVAQLQTGSVPDAEDENGKSLQILLTSVTRLLIIASNEDLPYMAVDDIDVFWRLKYIFSGKDLDFTQNLVNIIYLYIMKEPHDDTISDLYITIWVKVQCCMGLVSWWLNTQAIIQSGKVTDTLIGPEPEVSETKAVQVIDTDQEDLENEEPAHQDNKSHTENNKSTFLVREITLISDAEVTDTDREDSDHKDNKLLSDEKYNFNNCSKTFRKLTKDIFTDLHGKWKSTKKYILSSIHCFLNSQNKTGFFTTCRKSFVNIVKRRNRVGVI